MARLTTEELPTGASLTAANDRITALRAAMRAAGGFPMTIAPTDVTGSGSAAHAAFTMPSTDDMPRNAGDKFVLNGFFQVLADDGGPLVVAIREVKGLVVSYSGSAWNVRRTGDFSLKNKHASFADYFAADANFPDIEDNAGSLSALYTGVSSAAFKIEGDFTIAALGQDSAG